jgi:hypothetical protein
MPASKALSIAELIECPVTESGLLLFSGGVEG